LPFSDARTVGAKGETALMMAVERAHLGVVKMLLPHSNARAIDADGASAITHTIARDKYPWSDGAAECAELLAPHSPARHAAAALRHFGAKRMPRWAAETEARALRREVTRAKRHPVSSQPTSTPSMAPPSISEPVRAARRL
jgi:hypothetical protein